MADNHFTGPFITSDLEGAVNREERINPIILKEPPPNNPPQNQDSRHPNKGLP